MIKNTLSNGLSFITEPTQRSVSYSATQMSAIQADIGRSTSLPGSIALATLENFESHEEHQPSTKLLRGPSSAISSDSDFTSIQKDHNQSSVEDEEIQTNVRKFNSHQADATNHMEKSYADFQPGMYNTIL
jgi:hypothetical protein